MRLQLPGIDRRPEIQGDLSNQAEVAEFFQSHMPNVGFQKFFHRAMNKLVAPHVVVDPEMRDDIQAHLLSDDPTGLALSHHTWFDPSDDAAAFEQEKEVFGPAIGKFVIPARADYFNYPVIGDIISFGGARPMARRKDVRNYYKKQGLSGDELKAAVEAKEEEREIWNKGMQRLLVDMSSEDGGVYTSYIEGTRNRGDQLKLQKVRDGIKDWLSAMEPEERERAKILCVSHDYGGRFDGKFAGRFLKRFLTPTIYITMVDAPADPEDVNELLHATLEDGLSLARKNRYDGAPLSPLGKLGALAAVAAGAVVADKIMSRRR